MKGLSLWQQFWYYLGHNGTYVLQQFNHHFAISVYGVLLAALVGIPLGILISRHHHLNGPIISIANIIQTIPSLAMVSMLMLVLGLG
ncbi:MAG: ABC transporter permease, partial [Limosilactobacillus mucosae]|nr:ABC transporter permease [Limosilactobacillus mucosae]